MGVLLTRLALASVILVVCQTAAEGQQPDKPTPDDLNRAKTLASSGDDYYDEGKYLQAIVAYREAYELSGAAGFLYNIAQAYRLGGDCGEAYAHYKRYLSEATSTNRHKRVKRHLTELKECAGVTDPEVTPNQLPKPDDGQGDEAKDPASQPADPTPAVRDSPGRNKRLIGLATAVVGVASLATGAYFANQARGLSNDVDAATSGPGPIVWNEQLQGLENDGKSAQTNAIILLSVGSAAVLAGTTLYLLGMRDKRSTSTAWVAPSTHGTTIGWSWQF